jgi:hypothetical protein
MPLDEVGERSQVAVQPVQPVRVPYRERVDLAGLDESEQLHEGGALLAVRGRLVVFDQHVRDGPPEPVDECTALCLLGLDAVPVTGLVEADSAVDRRSQRQRLDEGKGNHDALRRLLG